MNADAPTKSAREIFLAATKLAQDQQHAFLDEACCGDALLRERVQELLEAHAAAGSFLDPVTGLATMGETPLGEVPGTVIGPYKLLQEIGEGGFGVVFMAEQTHPVQRKVALKIIKPGMDTRQVIARFEAERQALALMDHPNIAKVFDAGTTNVDRSLRERDGSRSEPTTMADPGRPYFVMELVRGVPITTYCDEKHLTLKERLELFIPVCQAIQHAHQKGIIHRDIKPSNILIALYDGQPMPKVIDFGVAKATGPKLTERTMFTGFGQVVGTVEYMSPEQAELNQLDIDTRSDIYSLGVLLYELLSGSTPFDRRRLCAVAFDEMLRIIREEEPLRPSTRLSTLEKGALSTVCQCRGVDTRQLRQRMRGELDWIVMKCLEKDRNRRYETANGLARDIQRYLADEPIEARRPSVAYRFRKFARRNRGVLTVVGLILLIVVTAATSIGWMVRDRDIRQSRINAQVALVLEDVERLQNEQNWPGALSAVRRAEAALAGGEADEGTRQQVREALNDLEFIDRLERIRMQTLFGIDPEFQYVQPDREYAWAFREYGADIERLPLETSLARLKARPAIALAVAAALDAWVGVRQSAERIAPIAPDIPLQRDWKRLLAIARGVDPDPLRDRIRALWEQGITEDSQAELRRLAESIDVRTLHPSTPVTFALILDRAKLTDSTLRLLQDAQYAHPSDFWINVALGERLFLDKQYERAVRYLSVAVVCRPNSTLAHIALGHALSFQGKEDEGLVWYRRAIEIVPKDAGTQTWLGSILTGKGDLDRAIGCFQAAIAIDPKYAYAHVGLGNALKRLGKLDEAAAHYRAATELDPKTAKAKAHVLLGHVLLQQRRLDEAIAHCREAVHLFPDVAGYHTTLAAALRINRLLDEAIDEHRRAISLERVSAEDHVHFALTLQEKGFADEAIAQYRKAIEIDSKYVDAHGQLGNALFQQGNVDEAIACYRTVIEPCRGRESSTRRSRPSANRLRSNRIRGTTTARVLLMPDWGDGTRLLVRSVALLSWNRQITGFGSKAQHCSFTPEMSKRTAAPVRKCSGGSARPVIQSSPI